MYYFLLFLLFISTISLFILGKLLDKFSFIQTLHTPSSLKQIRSSFGYNYPKNDVRMLNPSVEWYNTDNDYCKFNFLGI